MIINYTSTSFNSILLCKLILKRSFPLKETGYSTTDSSKNFSSNSGYFSYEMDLSLPSMTKVPHKYEGQMVKVKYIN